MTGNNSGGGELVELGKPDTGSNLEKIMKDTVWKKRKQNAEWDKLMQRLFVIGK